MTNSEIVKVLECCGTVGDGCKECPLKDRGGADCQFITANEAYKLINRQQAEIEKAKSEAVREFAEKLKERAFEFPIAITFGFGTEWVKEAVSVIEIDNLVKEMMEGENG